MDMLDHQKAVITNVVGDEELFIKELKKSLSWLKKNEIMELHTWLKEKYGSSHTDLINMVFEKELLTNYNLNA